MPISNPSPYTGPEKIKYLFIDGGALDSLLESLSAGLFNSEKLEIDYQILAEDYSKIFYYDCYPAQKTGESTADYEARIQPKSELFSLLRSLDGFHVYEGTSRYRKRRGGQEQKQVDIMIAVDMLTHSFRRNMHAATLLTGDLDFKPLIDALVQEGMHVSLWYPKGRANYELVDAADSRRALTIWEVGRRLGQYYGYYMEQRLPQPSPRHYFLENPPHLDPSWRQLETTGEATFYVQASTYCAHVPKPDGDDYFYMHNDLEQLSFYIQNVYGPNVVRENMP